MNKYPEHSVVRIHTNTLKLLREFCKQANENYKRVDFEHKIQPPDAIDLMVDYFLERETNIRREENK